MSTQKNNGEESKELDYDEDNESARRKSRRGITSETFQMESFYGFLISLD